MWEAWEVWEVWEVWELVETSEININGEPLMEGLSDFINQRMEEWKVPGLAVAIVNNSEIIFFDILTALEGR
ncbi:hypothetical protein BJP34_17670 [Moorena producens PAL-8-15-08-1]|uniref:Uncharacterized protein n=1 Tax=Moorena producens PAL-8-15-08-1 TaxID=1458985 RepID=A0A1D8TU73_9CYAN|nr:hypothetical protein [Moorena producens]AOX01026.1 hypothetical protein BJP34_17670 [Moorena producens PAL-8-15-08-1]